MRKATGNTHSIIETVEKEMCKEENYWMRQLSGELPILNLPLDYRRSAKKSFLDDSVECVLSHKVAEQLKVILRETDTTLYIISLSVINILLSKYTGQDDIIVGNLIMGESYEDFRSSCDMLAMRNYPKSEKLYRAFLQEVRETVLKAYENRSYPIDELLEKLNLLQNKSCTSLFNVIYVHQNTRKLGLKELSLDGSSSEKALMELDLVFTTVEVGGEILFRIEYCTSLFKRETIERLCIHLENLIKAIVADQNMLLANIDILSKSEQDQILYEFNATCIEYSQEKTVHQLFEEQVKRTPDKTVLVFNENSMTYAELNSKANQLAQILRDKGVKPDTIVGLVVERSFEMMIGILGILKASGAYLPIDPKYPEKRIQFMLENSGTNILLTQSHLEEGVIFDGEKINLDEIEVYVGNDINLELINSPQDLVYLMYTSGSTGEPKGVMVEHQSVVNYIHAYNETIKLTNQDNVLQQSTFTFDMFVEEVFPILSLGGSIVVITKDTLLDIPNLIDVINKHNVTTLSTTPQILNQLNNHHHSLVIKNYISGGDVLRDEDINHLAQRSLIYNSYGPTECTVSSSLYKYDLNNGHTAISVGKPIGNTKIYILDRHNKLVPIGVPGELCISGKGVARGYLNLSELTKEKFIKNPFGEGRLYRTGDFARWMSDGNIEYLGRIDEQVKIRGFRIELGEVASLLRKQTGVKEAAVIVREDKADKVLQGYVVLEEGMGINGLRESLLKGLPEHMIPNYLMEIEKIPLTVNGKLDKKNLPKIGIRTSEYLAPRNEMEAALGIIWSEALGWEEIGVNDNFFELGGHSLKAVSIINRLASEFKINVSVAEFYNHPSISQIAEYLVAAKTDEIRTVEGLVLLRRGKQAFKNIFFIHALNGTFVYMTLINSIMNDNFYYWGINYERVNLCDPYAVPLEDLAMSYIKKIKKIQKKGPYYISGWCIGGTIAFEMTRQMEEMNDEIKFVGMYDSWVINEKPDLCLKDSDFPIETELQIVDEVLGEYNLPIKYKLEMSVEELWKEVVENLSKKLEYSETKEKIFQRLCSIDEASKIILKNYKQMAVKDMLADFNMGRSLSSSLDRYSSKAKIKAPISYFIATQKSDYAPPEIEGWNKNSYKGVNYYKVDGNHFTIFENESAIKEFSIILTNILNDE